MCSRIRLVPPGTVTVKPAGVISAVEADVSAWWAEGITALGMDQPPKLTVALSISLTADSSPHPLDAPCDDPVVDSSEAVPVLACP